MVGKEKSKEIVRLPIHTAAEGHFLVRRRRSRSLIGVTLRKLRVEEEEKYTV